MSYSIWYMSIQMSCWKGDVSYTQGDTRMWDVYDGASDPMNVARTGSPFSLVG